MNGLSFKYNENTISLILFADAATYNKSGNKSIWAIFSSIVELPPILRESYENIIFHSLWSGSNPDFNVYLKEYNNELDELLEKGFIFNNKKFNLRIFLFQSDSPARAKACKSVQFNGKYGCLMCLHPTVYTNKTIYPVLQNINLRTKQIYDEQVAEAVRTGLTYFGIKDFSYLSNWITIPDNVLIDYMHLSIEGVFKVTFFNFFNSKNHDQPYYLGK